MPILYLFALIATGFAGWRAWRRLRYFLHLFQLETYKPSRYMAWLRTHARHVLVRRSHVIGFFVLLLAAGAYAAWELRYGPALLALMAWPVVFASSKLYRSEREKKPLAYTSRMLRLLALSAVLALAPVALGLLLGQGLPGRALAYLAGWGIADLGAPLWVWLAAQALRPVEHSIQEGFKRDARRHLADRPDLTVVGITGSYGKTSTKFVVREILKQKYHVLASPGSYNTPMGLCLVINTKLQPEHQVLVLEYGMRYPGDIAELCAIATPDVAVVTTIGLAHLETMGSVDAIAREKGTLVEALRADGTAVLNAGDDRVAAMTDRAPGAVRRVRVDDDRHAGDGPPAEDDDVALKHGPVDLRATDLRYDTEGTTFTLHEGDASVEVRTKLLGRHNVLNVLLGAAVGRVLGLRLRQIAHAAARVEPIEHRLALRREGQVTIIDDAFNSNPVGARNAVEILAQMEGGRRVIVTPGMVELGARQDEENRALGTHIARHTVDLVVLVGDAQTKPLQEGLREAGYPEARVRVFGTLFTAQDFLKQYLRPGDTVLYENDLPDQYET